MLGQWLGAVVEPDEGAEPPAMDDPRPVEVPGRPAAFSGADAVAYRTTLSDPPADGETRATLELAGVYGHARVWIDGQLRATRETYFDPLQITFVPEPETEIVIACQRPTDAFGGVYETELVPERQSVPGIWWDATVTPHGPVALLDLSVTPKLTDDGGVIDAAMTVDAIEPVDDRITLSLRPQGFRGGGAMERVRVEAAADERVVVNRRIDVRDPQLWWPRGVGSQHRYEVRAKLGATERIETLGFSTIEYDDELLVNGRVVPARGFDVLPGSSPETAVERAVDANANLLRAHAHVPSPAFYEACDEAGVLVWQDLPLTGPVEYDIERGTAVGSALVEYCESHPSVAAYSVHDDPRTPFSEPLGSGLLARAKVRWRAWRTSFDRTNAMAVAEVLETDRPVFPVTGPPGTTPDAVHLYPGWEYARAEDVEWLVDTYAEIADVVTEFGVGSLTDVAPDAPFGHRAFERLEESDPAETQRVQGRTLKHVAEHLRRRGCDVVTAFALRDVQPGGGMGILDASGRTKRGFDDVAAAYEPVQVVVNETPATGTVGLTVLNDSHKPVSGTVEWESGGRSGGTDVDVEPLGRTAAGGATVPEGADELRLRLILGDQVIENEYRIA